MRASLTHDTTLLLPPPPVTAATAMAGTATGPEVVKDVHGRIIAFKGRRLSGWAVAELIRLVRGW